MDLRREFVEDYLTDAFTMTELCASYHVSRKTGYKMLARFEAEGWRGLADRSCRPHTMPQAIPATIEEAVRRAREKHPEWGARKLRRWLMVREPTVGWPSRGTIHAILGRAGLVRRVRGRRPPMVRDTTRLRVATGPNAIWTIDFKGDFRLGNGGRCYPLTLRDLASRYTLRCDALGQPDGVTSQRRIERAFAEFGLPECIRSDNGQPFAGLGVGGLSQLNVSWLQRGIAIEHIAPGRPDQNGSHEQFHRVLKAHTARPPAESLSLQQDRFDRFRREYNEERPHEALGDDVPAQRYVPSTRPWSARPPRLEYPGHWETRRVGSNGCVRLRNTLLFVSTALAGHDVAFEEIDDGLWTLHFGRFALARWREPEAHIRPLPVE